MDTRLRRGTTQALSFAALTIAAPTRAQAPVDPTGRTIFDGLAAESHARPWTELALDWLRARGIAPVAR
jgi:hypothetical protein